MSTIAAVTGATTSMWDASPLKGTGAPSISNTFKLADTRVPSELAAAPKQPLSQFWQSALKFEHDQAVRLDTLKANQKADQQRKLREQANLLPAANTYSRTAAANTTQAMVTPRAAVSTTYAYSGYTALGTHVQASALSGQGVGSVVNVKA
jgi:hypothetical protein